MSRVSLGRRTCVTYIGEVPNASATLIGMGDDYDFVATVDELAAQLVDVTFDTAGLWEEEVADHSDVVRHLDGFLSATMSYELGRQPIKLMLCLTSITIY